MDATLSLSPSGWGSVPSGQGAVPPGAAQVRFLNALVEGGPTLRLTVGSRLLSTALSPGGLTPYEVTEPGFPLFTLYDAQAPWRVLFRSPIPLSPGDVVTLAVIPSGGGVDLLRVDDRPCGVRGSGWACLRCADLVQNSPGLDLLLTDGRTVFRSMSYKEVTTYRRALPGVYDLYLAMTPTPTPQPGTDMETVEALPAVVSSPFLPGLGWPEPLLSFPLEVRAGSQLTAYLMGTWGSGSALQVKITENF